MPRQKGGQAPEEQKPGPPTDVKSEGKPAEAKVGGKWLKLSPEEKDRVRNWNLPGLQSWMRTKGDPGLGPLLQYLTNDAAKGRPPKFPWKMVSW